MEFIVDAQLPPALARLMVAEGYQAKHLEDIGMQEAEDPDIWQYALENQAVIITKDEDFYHRFTQAPSKAPVIVWLRVLNCSKHALLDWFKPLLKDIVTDLEQGERIIEVQ